MPRSGDAVLCPVRAWAAITARVLAYPTATFDTPVNAILLAGRLQYATAHAMLQHLRRGAAHFGPQLLGYAPDELGTHSIRAGAAMAMYLAGVPVFVIMLVGRWASDSFLRYIRCQVAAFTNGVSERMLSPPDSPHIPRASAHGHRLHAHLRAASGRSLLPTGLSDQSRHAAPAFSLHH